MFSTGFRHIKPDGQISEWTSDQGKVTNAVANGKQIALSIQGGEIVYFELDNQGSITEKDKVTLDSEILCMAISDIPKDRQRAKYLACGFTDNTVRLFSLDVGSSLLKVSGQAMPTTPESVCLIEYDDPGFIKGDEDY